MFDVLLICNVLKMSRQYPRAFCNNKNDGEKQKKKKKKEITISENN